MKMKHLLLLAALFFASVAAYAQEVPAKSNAIVVTLSDSNNVSDKVTKVLTGRDYTINAGKNPALISTAARTLKNGTRLSISTQIKGAEVIIMGKIMVAGQSNMTIEYKGGKGTPFMNGWEEMEKIAKALGGKNRYETK